MKSESGPFGRKGRIGRRTEDASFGSGVLWGGVACDNERVGFVVERDVGSDPSIS